MYVLPSTSTPSRSSTNLTLTLYSPVHPRAGHLTLVLTKTKVHGRLRLPSQARRQERLAITHESLSRYRSRTMDNTSTTMEPSLTGTTVAVRQECNHPRDGQHKTSNAPDEIRWTRHWAQVPLRMPSAAVRKSGNMACMRHGYAGHNLVVLASMHRQESSVHHCSVE